MAKSVPRVDKIAGQVVGRMSRLADGEVKRMPKRSTLSPARQLQDFYDGVHAGKVESGEVDERQWARYVAAMQKLEREQIDKQRRMGNA